AAAGSPSAGAWPGAGSGATVTAVSSTMSWTMSCCCASVAGSRRWARDFLRSGRCGLGVETPVMLTGRLIASSQRKFANAETEFGGLTPSTRWWPESMHQDLRPRQFHPVCRKLVLKLRHGLQFVLGGVIHRVIGIPTR